jgi:hypothetical protein
LLDAADRGVTVEVAKEAVGDFFESVQRLPGHEGRQIRPALEARFGTIRASACRTTTNHDHAKVYVFDGQTLMPTAA